jgi:hypothetical protein
MNNTVSDMEIIEFCEGIGIDPLNTYCALYEEYELSVVRKIIVGPNSTWDTSTIHLRLLGSPGAFLVILRKTDGKKSLNEFLWDYALCDIKKAQTVSYLGTPRVVIQCPGVGFVPIYDEMADVWVAKDNRGEKIGHISGDGLHCYNCGQEEIDRDSFMAMLRLAH